MMETLTDSMLMIVQRMVAPDDAVMVLSEAEAVVNHVGSGACHMGSTRWTTSYDSRAGGRRRDGWANTQLRTG